jgi:hypothetical protein
LIDKNKYVDVYKSWDFYRLKGSGYKGVIYYFGDNKLFKYDFNEWFVLDNFKRYLISEKIYPLSKPMEKYA